MKTIRLDKLLSSRGYCSRGAVPRFIAQAPVLVSNQRPRFSDKVLPEAVTVSGEALDPGPGLVIMLNKPVGYTCSRSDLGQLVYELLPERFVRRNPLLSSVGRLDCETSGLLLFTDDGQLLHRLTSPRHKTKKIYQVELADPLRGDEVTTFASGSMLLQGETEPLLPATFVPTGQNTGTITLIEGRYHQIRRMFSALGNQVTKLHRSQVGSLTLGDLTAGNYRILSQQEITELGND